MKVSIGYSGLQIKMVVSMITTVTLGAQPDSFSNAAIAKPRRAHDEIYRKDNTALPSQTAILGDVLKRRGNKPALNINNAVKQLGMIGKMI